MTNFEVYKKTLSFSLVSFLIGLGSLAIVAGFTAGGFFILNGVGNSRGFVGLGIGLVIGIIISVLINIFILNRIKAAQLGMMAKGVVDGQLPEGNVFKEGLNEVKGRFAKITLFFFVTGAIKGAFRQLGRAINRVGTAVGGDVGNGITSAIDSAIQILISYLCDCCLAWVMYNKDRGVARCACEGAVIFFKHGKTLIANIGRIFGLGFLSFAVIGGAFFGISYLISTQMPQVFDMLVNEIREVSTRNGGTVPDFLTNPTVVALFVSGIVGIILWSMIHSLLIRPFILVGVIRNFMNAGLSEQVTDADFNILDVKSSRFAKLHSSI